MDIKGKVSPSLSFWVSSEKLEEEGTIKGESKSNGENGEEGLRVERRGVKQRVRVHGRRLRYNKRQPEDRF